MKIVSIKKVTPRTVYAIGTSTKTFISDGLAHHNCCGCNTYREGEQAKHLIHIENTLGREVVDELMELERKWKAGDYMKIGVHEIRDLQGVFKEKTKELEDS